MVTTRAIIRSYTGEFFITLSIIRLTKLKKSSEFRDQQMSIKKNIFSLFYSIIVPVKQQYWQEFQDEFRHETVMHKNRLDAFVSLHTPVRLASKNDKI